MHTRLLHELCSVPTAPFAEHHVIAYIKRFVADRPALRLRSDTAGNLLIELPRPKGKTLPRLVFTAHMDHPGCIARKMISPTNLRGDFRGGVLGKFVLGAKVRFFDNGHEIVGKITQIETTDPKRPEYPKTVIAKVPEPISPGSIGMFDQIPARTRGKKFYSRVCDDLAGAAAALTMIVALLKKNPKVPVALLLTRAEEDGFIGAIAAATSGTLIKKSDRLIAIEASSAQPFAPIGGGAIIRVGDRTSIFNSALTFFLNSQAQILDKKDKHFKFQRALMPGGTCEATVYDTYGYTAASICIPLGNYHNMDKTGGKIAPEFIDLNDWQSMTQLFIQIAASAHQFDPDNPQLKQRLEKRFKKLKILLENNSPRRS